MLNRLTLAFCYFYFVGFIIPLPGDRGHFLNTYFPLKEEVVVVKKDKPNDKPKPPTEEIDEKELYVKSIKKIYKKDFPMEVIHYIESLSKDLKLDYNLVLGVIAAESSFNAQATSSVGAVGYIQVWPKWHQEAIAGRNIMDPKVNIEVGMKYLKHCIEKRGDLFNGLACYNGAKTKDSANRYWNKVMTRKHELQLSNLKIAGY